MKNIIYIIFLFTFIGCSKDYNMDTPIIANNFSSFMKEINNVCKNVDKELCDNIKGIIIAELPDAKNDDYTPIAEEVQIAKNIFNRLNGKSSSEIIQIYKNTLLENLDTARQRDIDINTNLQLLYDSYESTKKYATYINVTDIKIINSNNISDMKLQFTITNNSTFNITELVGEAEFYSYSDILIGRTKSFLEEINPILQSKRKTNITINLSSISKSDLSMIRAAKNIKIKVTVSSVRTTSEDEHTKNLILSLPYSYYRMKELLAESEKVYNDTVKKINSIRTH